MLTIAELKDLIKDLPDNMPVVIHDLAELGHMHATSIDTDSWVYKDCIDDAAFSIYDAGRNPEDKVQVALLW